MDPIADLLTRIRNAQKAGREKTEIPFSRIKFEIVQIFQKEGYLKNAERKGPKGKEKIEIILKYDQGNPAVQEIKRISRLGQRKYVSAKAIRPVKQGYGLAIISTSAGILTDKEAKKKGLGGEVLLEIS